ncbi:unnamed protein product [Phytophthora fragariaefolia]|uniref:Unnamed protein product n=1 Tax=Phytophthora fragariaefolia TaxID=1490495 RepID=A0A9W6U928_9STRA|nr:unnamed protein product [Phytophthora fragariaefolia]
MQWEEPETSVADEYRDDEDSDTKYETSNLLASPKRWETEKQPQLSPLATVEWPTIEDAMTAQSGKVATSHNLDGRGVYVDSYHRPWVPDTTGDFLQRLVVIAHRGSQDHRGVNATVKELEGYFDINNNFTVAYCLWINGSVERINRDILQVLRVMVLEFRLRQEQWVDILPVTQANLNQTSVQSLAGLAPIEVFTGLEKPSPLESIVVTSDDGKECGHFINGSTRDVHTFRLKHYADSPFEVTAEIVEHIVNQAILLTVREFVQHRLSDDHDYDILVAWEGLEDSENSWEPIRTLYEDVQVKLQQYVDKVGGPQLALHM